MTAGGVHPEHEDDAWTVNVGDHPGRTDSPQYVRSRTLMVKLVQQAQPWWFGDKPYQDHHGGGVWLKDATGWLLAFGSAGIEWCAQFCADPVKVDRLRQQAWTDGPTRGHQLSMISANGGSRGCRGPWRGSRTSTAGARSARGRGGSRSASSARSSSMTM